MMRYLSCPSIDISVMPADKVLPGVVPMYAHYSAEEAAC